MAKKVALAVITLITLVVVNGDFATVNCEANSTWATPVAATHCTIDQGE